MVFTSIPEAYLDAANWQQQQQNHHHYHHQHGFTSQQLLPPPPLPPTAPPQPHGGINTSSIRPGSMTDRARMANLPLPETALKCPRCESTNTKFCYFNNYSLSQPRHFCKTCRRYWTRGGAMRSVPVGGGCRRNKRSKGSNSSNSNNSSIMSPANSDRQAGSTASSINSISSNNTVSATDHMVGFAPLRFMAPLHHQHQHQVQLNDFGTGDLGLIYGPSYSPNYGPVGGELGTVLGNDLEQWRMPMPISLSQQQQFPFLEGSQATNLYPFETNGSNHNNHYEAFTSGGYMRPKVISTSGVINQLASVKMEDSNINKELNLSSHFLGISSINNQASDQQYWTSVGSAGAASAVWNDIPSFSSSSNTSNHM